MLDNIINEKIEIDENATNEEIKENAINKWIIYEFNYITKKHNMDINISYNKYINDKKYKIITIGEPSLLN